MQTSLAWLVGEVLYYRKIIELAPNYLNEKGCIYFEIGYNQSENVSKLMKAKFKNIEILKDYEGNDRVVLGEFLWLKN